MNKVTLLLFIYVFSILITYSYAAHHHLTPDNLTKNDSMLNHTNAQQNTANHNEPPFLSCRLTSDSTLSLRHPVEISIIVKNESTFPVKLLTWYTPFEGFLSDLVRLQLNGKPLSYQGPMVKRSNPSAEDYLVFAPQQVHIAKLDLSAAYNLATGEAHVALKPKLAQLIVNHQQVFQLLCEAQALNIQFVH